MHLLTKLRNAIKPPLPITTTDGLRIFLQEKVARMSGEIVIKYAQKRLGKLHYSLAKTDTNYTKDLVNCQIKIHAQMLSDVMVMICQLLKTVDSEQAPQLVEIMHRVHNTYVESAPKGYDVEPALAQRLMSQEKKKVGELAKKTGILVFKTLPVTSDLLPGNAQIFQGQVRLLYISFLQEFGKRADFELLAQDLGLERSQDHLENA